MSEHLTREDLQRFRQGDLPPDRVIAVSRHLAACEACAAGAGQTSGTGAADSLRLALAGTPEHPTSEELAEYVDGAGGEGIVAHLSVCPMCRAEANDLAEFRRRIAPSRWWIIAASVAAVVMIVVTVMLFRTEPGGETISVPRALRSLPRPNRWESVVAQAIAARHLDPPPFLRELRGGQDDIRGHGPSAGNAALEPAGVVVMTDRPLFRWRAEKERHAVVSIFDESRRVARSGLLDVSEWRPDAPLPRGRRYEWQVELHDGTTRILPAPPDPPAAFHVMDEQSFRELTAARQARPGDHLLLAVLYARAGAQADALRELAAYQAAHPDDVVAQQLAESLQNW